jgi:hypothetical protein
MTDRPRATARRPRRPRPIAVVAASLAVFLAVFALLASQMRAGRDPALGAAARATRAAAHRTVLVRRVVLTRRVVVIEDDDARAGGRASLRGVPPTVLAAPAPAPPAPVTAAPAPAPAPVVTRSS